MSNANRPAARLFRWTGRYRQTGSWRALVRARRHDWQVGAGSQYFQPAVHSDGCVAARLRFLHNLWHAAPCRSELFSPAVEASSKSFAHLPRHGPRRRPTSGKPSNQPGEPTMPLTCIRKRSTDGLRCEGTWACACGAIERPFGPTMVECDHAFLRWQQYSQSKIAYDSRVNSRSQSTPTRALSNRPQSRTNKSLVCGVRGLFLVGLRRALSEIGPAERHYSNGCTGGRDDAPVFGLVAGFKEPPNGLVIELFCGRGGIGLPEMPGRGYVGGLLGAGGPPADSGSVADGSCRWAEEFVAVDKVAAIIVAASREMILFFTCISLEASLKGCLVHFELQLLCDESFDASP